MKSAKEDSDTGWGERHLNYAIHGQFQLRYVGRERQKVHDRDLYELLRIDLGSEGKDRVTGAFFGRMGEDLDGVRRNRGFRMFESVGDTYKDRFESILYYGYLDVHHLPMKIAGTELVRRLRVGRQQVYEVENAYFDGVKIETGEWKRAARLQAILYGGVPVTLYDSTHSGDYLYGVGLQIRPWTGARIRADWTYAHDENDSLFFGSHSDSLASLSFWQRVNDEWSFFGRFTALDADSRDAMLRATWQKVDWDLMASLAYTYQFRRLNDLSLVYDRFTKALRTLEPYHTIAVNAHKGICEHLSMEFRGSVRDLVDGSDEGPYNRRYERWGLLILIGDLPWKGTSISVNGDYWTSNSVHLSTVGAELKHEFPKGFTAALGTDYSLYKYDILSADERQDVRTGYLTAQWKFAKGWRWDSRLEMENNDFSRFTTVQTTLRLDF